MTMPNDLPPVDDMSHVALRLGRLMLINGADAGHVHAAVARFASDFGYAAQVLVSTEALIVTLQSDEALHTRLGHAMSGTAVDMGALDALDAIVRDTGQQRLDMRAIDQRLEAVERGRNRYPSWLIVVGMGITAASLARLFGGPWPVVGVSALVGLVSTSLRLLLGRWHVNSVASAFLVVLVSAVAGARAMEFFPGLSPTLCLVTAGMILVPGVPLLNGVREMLGSHPGTGLVRLALAAITVLAIAFALFLAAALSGDMLPLDSSPVLLYIGEDFLFSALAAIGFSILFDVPIRQIWGCILCGMAGHGLRTVLEHYGWNIAAGSLVGALAVGLLARIFARLLRVPAVTFAFPGVVAMIPGSYAFRAGIGGLAIMNAGAAAPVSLIGDTAALAITTVLMTAAIGIGLSIALASPFAIPRHSSPGELLQRQEQSHDTLRSTLDRR
jgi:uncharacterized membrane protein YjjP (DUF1212 family)